MTRYCVWWTVESKKQKWHPFASWFMSRYSNWHVFGSHSVRHYKKWWNLFEKLKKKNMEWHHSQICQRRSRHPPRLAEFWRHLNKIQWFRRKACGNSPKEEAFVFVDRHFLHFCADWKCLFCVAIHLFLDGSPLSRAFNITRRRRCFVGLF